MKKFFLFAFAALSMTAMAQHVTPVNIQISELKLDSLRTLYISEPAMYRAALAVVVGQLEQDANAIKAAKQELKTEQNHAKQMEACLREATATAARLKKLYGNESDELKAMQKHLEKQQKTLNKQIGLNQETTDSYLTLLEREQKDLGYALREVADRLQNLSQMEISLQNAQTNLQAYVQEVQTKAQQIAQLEALLKERMAIIKNEQKAAKSLQ